MKISAEHINQNEQNGLFGCHTACYNHTYTCWPDSTLEVENIQTTLVDPYGIKIKNLTGVLLKDSP